jgi:hypothetical protein
LAALTVFFLVNTVSAETWKERGEQVFKDAADKVRPYQNAATDLAKAGLRSAKDWKTWKERYEDSTKAMDDLVTQGLPKIQDWLTRQWRNARDPREKAKYAQWLGKVRNFEFHMVDVNRSYKRILPAVNKAKSYLDLAGEIMDQHKKAKERRGGPAAYGLHMVAWLGHTFGDKVPLVGSLLKNYSDVTSALLDATDKLAADIVAYRSQGGIGPGGYGGEDNPQWKLLVAQFGKDVLGKGTFFPQEPVYLYGPDDDPSLRFIWDPQEETWTKVPAGANGGEVYRQALLAGRILSPQQLTVWVLNDEQRRRLQSQAEEIRGILNRIRDHIYTMSLVLSNNVPWRVTKYLPDSKEFSAHYLYSVGFKKLVRQAVKAVRANARRELAAGEGPLRGLDAIYKFCRELERWGDAVGMKLAATTRIIFQVVGEQAGPLPKGQISLKGPGGSEKQRRITFRKGWGRIYVVPGGTYQLTARAENFQPAVQNLRVRADSRPDMDVKIILAPLAWKLAIKGPSRLRLGQRGQLTARIQGGPPEKGAKLVVAWLDPKTGREARTGPTLHIKRDQGPGKVTVTAVLYQVKNGQRQKLAQARHNLEFVAVSSLRFTAADRETRRKLAARWELKGPTSFSRGPAAVINISPIPAGIYQVVVRAQGYHSLKGPLTIRAGKRYDKVALLKPLPEPEAPQKDQTASPPPPAKPTAQEQAICACYQEAYLASTNKARKSAQYVSVVSAMTWDPALKQCVGQFRLPPPYRTIHKDGSVGPRMWWVKRSLSAATKACQKHRGQNKPRARGKSPCGKFTPLAARTVTFGENQAAYTHDNAQKSGKRLTLRVPGPGTLRITVTSSGKHQYANHEYGFARWRARVTLAPNPAMGFKGGWVAGGRYFPGVTDKGTNSHSWKLKKAGSISLTITPEVCQAISGKGRMRCCSYGCGGKTSYIQLPGKHQVKVEFKPACP